MNKPTQTQTEKYKSESALAGNLLSNSIDSSTTTHTYTGTHSHAVVGHKSSSSLLRKPTVTRITPSTVVMPTFTSQAHGDRADNPWDIG